MFFVGDVVKQAFQWNAAERLVVGFTPSGLPIVWDRKEQKIRWVHNWSHYKIAIDDKAVRLLKKTSHIKWILGDQI